MQRVLGFRPVAVFLAIAWTGCHGQFDFDTSALDGGPDSPANGPDAEDDGTSVDATSDRSRPDIHISCGDTTCETSGCCTATSSQTCIDVAGGGSCSGLLIQCDDSDDCSEGMVCCAEAAKGDDDRECLDASCQKPQRLQRVHCEPEAHCASLHYVVLCNPDRPEPCTECVASTLPGLPPGYHQCADAR
jgi:hypothetical protein